MVDFGAMGLIFLTGFLLGAFFAYKSAEKDTLNRINRQKAYIEELEEENYSLKQTIRSIEAVKVKKQKQEQTQMAMQMVAEYIKEKGISKESIKELAPLVLQNPDILKQMLKMFK